MDLLESSSFFSSGRAGGGEMHSHYRSYHGTAPPPPPPHTTMRQQHPVVQSKQRLQALATDRSQFHREMERRKQQASGSSISNTAQKLALRVPLQVAMEQGNRLYQESFSREERRQRERQRQEEKREAAEEEEEEEAAVPAAALRRPTFTIRPDLPPLYERAEAICKQRQEDLDRARQLREEAEKQQHQLGSSEAVNAQRVTARLMSEAQALDAKREHSRALALEATKNQGHPEINKRSVELTRKSHGQLTFLERQDRISQQLECRQLEREQKAKFEHQQEQPPLPALSPQRASRMITRLAEESAAELNHKRITQQEEFFAKRYPFQPKIDAKSRALAPSGSGGVLALHHNRQAEQRKQLLKQRVEAEAMRECTFHPVISTPPPTTTASSSWCDEYASSSSPSPPPNQEYRRRGQAKLERLERTRYELQMREVEECTFRPYIHAAPPPPPTVQVIPGLDGHLTRQRMIEERRVQQREREEKAFLTNLPPLTRRYTVAQPFRLSSNRLEEEDGDYDYY